MLNQDKKTGNIFFLILLFISLYLGYLIFIPFTKSILLSILIVIIAYPLHKKVRQEVKTDFTASLITTSFIFLFILIPGILFSIVLINQIMDFYPLASETLTNLFYSNNYIYSIPYIGDIYKEIQNTLKDWNLKVDISDTLKDNASVISTFLVEQGKNLFLNIGSSIASIFFILLIIFALFKDGKYYYEKIYNLIPLTEREKTFLFSQTFNATKAIFLGTILTAFAQSVLAVISYLILGLKFSIFWGFATFIASMIPIGGAAIVWLPVAIYAAFTKSILAGLLMVLWGTFGISMIDNIIRPWVIGERTQINSIILLFAILGGLKVFGFIGIFIAPIVVVLINNLLCIYNERFINSEEKTFFDPIQDNK